MTDATAEIVDAEIMDETPAAVPARPGDPDYNFPWDGTWKITTETSAYLIDFGAMTATRLPGEGGGCLPDLPEATVSDLRNDTEPIRMHHAPDPVVGERMELWLAIRDDGVLTYRHTTFVRSVELVVPGVLSKAPEHTQISNTPYTGKEHTV